MSSLIRIVSAILTEPELPIPKNGLTTGTIANVLQVVFGVAGGIALIVIVRAGFKYVISQGEPQEIEKAKNSILYAVAGLAVSIVAYSIVAFVLKEVK